MRSVVVGEAATLHHYRKCISRIVGRVVAVSEEVVVLETERFGKLNIRVGDGYWESERVSVIAERIRECGVYLHPGVVNRVKSMYDPEGSDEDIIWLLLRNR